MHNHPNHMSLKQAIQQYLSRRSARLSPNTIKRYRTVLNRFARLTGQEKAFDQVDDHDIELFQSTIKGELGRNTQRFYADILHTFFKFWVRRGKSEVVYADIEGPRRTEHVPNFISEEEFALIDDLFDEDDYYQLTKKLIFNLLWDTGMRIGELLALNIEDIDSNKRQVTIRTKKTDRLRVLVWSEYTHKLLLKYLGVRINLSDQPELFQTPLKKQFNSLNTRLSDRSVQRWCKKLEETLGFSINPHAFRHGKMRKILLSGGVRADVQVVAGHSSIVSSEVYVRLNEEGQRKLQDKFLGRSVSTKVQRPWKELRYAAKHV